MTRILIWGDSHVRRIATHCQFMDRIIGVSVEFRGLGGATVATLSNRCQDVIGYHTVVIMVGGNDLSNGWSSSAVSQSLENLATQVRGLGVRRVVLVSIWPRANRRYNDRARTVNLLLMTRYHQNRQIIHWQWDTRQPFATYDGTHLLLNGYRRAARYLVAAIVWSLNHQ